MSKASPAEPASAEDQIAALQLENEELRQQLNAAHKDRIDAEEARDRAIRSQSQLPTMTPQIPDDLGDYKGKYREISSGRVYGLKVLDPDKEDVRSNKTHHLKCATHFIDCTAEEFRSLFDKD